MAAAVSQRAHLARLIRVGLALGLGLALLACQPSPPQHVTVLAASSLQDVINPLLERIEREQGVSVRAAFAASSTLARQIQAGASADIFLSADVVWMDALQEAGHVNPGSRTQQVGNELVLVTSQANVSSVRPQQLASLLGDTARLALADPAHVPAGRYARAALELAGVWEDVAGRVVRADNVRAALALVARGEAAFGVVYRTDVALAPRVRIVAHFDASAQSPVRYSFALLRDAPHPQARDVFNALTDTRALGEFSAAGFVTP